MVSEPLLTILFTASSEEVSLAGGLVQPDNASTGTAISKKIFQVDFQGIKVIIRADHNFPSLRLDLMCCC